MVRILTFILFFSILTSQLWAQDLEFGEWVSHLPYQKGIAVTQSENKVYYATDLSIMSVDKSDLTLEYISKVEGLSTIRIKDVKYDPGSGYLFIIYSDNNIDIMTPDGIVNIADIKNNLGIFGDKRINNIDFDDETAFLSLGFGVVSYNTSTLEFGFTTQMGLKVNATAVDQNNLLYAATEDGIYTAELGATYNFGDFANWEFIGEEEGLPLVYDAKDIVFYNDGIYVLIDDIIYEKKDGMFSPFFTPSGSNESISFLKPSGDEMLIGIRRPSSFVSRVVYYDKGGNFSEGIEGCANFILDAELESNGRVWYADEWSTFRYSNSKTEACQKFDTPTPKSSDVSEIKIKDEVVYVASGGVTEAFNFLFNRDGIYIKDGSQWSNYNEMNVSFFKEKEMLNAFSIAPHPENGDVYIGSFYSGLFKANFAESVYENYNNDNSPIVGSQGSPSIEKISGLTFDTDGNLWITVYEGEKPLLVLTPEGDFISIPVDISSRIGKLVIDDFGNKWIQITGVGGGLLVYNDNGTISDPSDDRSRFFNSSNSNLKTNIINSITRDLDDNIWVGTAKGPIVFECGSDPFFRNSDNNFVCFGSIRTVLEDSIAAELLVTEDVRSIAIDGANRKWIGSRNGIFVQSPDGRGKVARYTVDNSVLFDNNIIDLEYDPQSGIMYIASNGGIQGIKTETTGGGKIHKSTTYAYPNPVRPDYDGDIAIRGLARDALYKITDIKGQLVHQGRALGGQAVWNGRDYNGRKVSTGVYLVFSNTDDITRDINSAVTKIMIVR